MFILSGDGKTHYIHQERKSNSLSNFTTITVDESFSVLKAISELRKLYDYEDKGEKFGIFFNFTLYRIKVNQGHTGIKLPSGL